MTIEIHRPELEALILQRMQTSGFHNIEDVLMQALTASSVTAGPSQVTAGPSHHRRMGTDLITALQASPHRELDIEPARFRSPMPARDVTL